MERGRSPKSRERFRKYASLGGWAFGLACGVVYTFMRHGFGMDLSARLLVAGGFILAGSMGVAYLLQNILRRRTVPYLMDLLQTFFFLWTAFGFVFLILAITDSELPEQGFFQVTLSLLVGTIVGVVFAQAVVLFVGRRLNVGEWEVIPFPIWIGTFAVWAWNRLRRSQG